MNEAELKTLKETWWPQILIDTQNEESSNALSRWSREIIFEYAFEYAAATDATYEECLSLYKDLANMVTAITTYENNVE